jgi:tetratricopeptide (TPR) repeat protein
MAGPVDWKDVKEFIEGTRSEFTTQNGELKIDSIFAIIDKGDGLFKNKKIEEAIPCFENAIKSLEQLENQNSRAGDENEFSDGFIASTTIKLERCLFAAKRYEESIVCCDKVIQMNPEDFVGLNGPKRGFLEHPAYFVAWVYKGNSLFELERFEESIVCCDKVIQMNPEDFVGWANKGECLDKLSKYPESISCYEKALEKDPNNETWQNSLDSVKSKLSDDFSSKTGFGLIEKNEPSEPITILKVRLAKGEITLEEYSKIKECLEN